MRPMKNLGNTLLRPCKPTDNTFKTQLRLSKKLNGLGEVCQGEVFGSAVVNPVEAPLLAFQPFAKRKNEWKPGGACGILVMRSVAVSLFSVLVKAETTVQVVA